MYEYDFQVPTWMFHTDEPLEGVAFVDGHSHDWIIDCICVDGNDADDLGVFMKMERFIFDNHFENITAELAEGEEAQREYLMEAALDARARL